MELPKVHEISYVNCETLNHSSVLQQWKIASFFINMEKQSEELSDITQWLMVLQSHQSSRLNSVHPRFMNVSARGNTCTVSPLGTETYEVPTGGMGRARLWFFDTLLWLVLVSFLLTVCICMACICGYAHTYMCTHIHTHVCTYTQTKASLSVIPGPHSAAPIALFIYF